MININITVIGVFIGLAGLLFNFKKLFSEISEKSANTRQPTILAAIALAFTCVAILFSVTPLEAALILIIILIIICALSYILLSRYNYKRQFLPQKYIHDVAGLYISQNNEVSYHLSNILKNLVSKSTIREPEINKILDEHFELFNRILLSQISMKDALFKISLLETLPDGYFKVVAEKAVPSDSISKMERLFRWKVNNKESQESKGNFKPLGIAGDCALQNKSLLYPDLTNEEIRQEANWIEITPHSKGGILCLPIDCPESYQHPLGGSINCLGVLSISCNKPNCLTEHHEEWIKTTFVNGLAAIILIHQIKSHILDTR